MLRAICLLAMAALSFNAGAAVTYRVDDGASMPYESNVLLRWRELVPSRANDNTIEGALVVAVRLNLAQWVNRNARLFLVLPQLDATSIRVTWTTQGRLLPGTIAPGNRVLVYSGPINTPLLEEALTLKIEADGTRFPDTRRLNFHFEIDLD